MPKDETGLAARRAALALLSKVTGSGAPLSEVQDEALARLDPAERARAQSLVLAALRHIDRLDSVIDAHLTKAPPLKMRNILRLAAAEMLVLDVPPHAAVDSAVRLTRADRKVQHLSKLANAVARRVSETDADAFAALPPTRMPAWIRKPVQRQIGAERVEAIEAVQSQRPPLDITLRDPATATQWAAELEAEILPTGSLRRARPGQVSALPGYAEGVWWVQDAAAALPARMLAPAPGMRILDLCAAPGGKTLQLAAAGADVTALDLSPARLKRVEENLSRTGLSAALVAADAREWAPDAPFDAILLDAPCSATGTLRRHPDLPFARIGQDLRPILQVQAALLARAADWLKPGGRLVYCTCSILPAEGPKPVADLLAAREDMQEVPLAIPGIDIPDSWRDGAARLRLYPDLWADRGGMDGFFATTLEKRVTGR
ncbi:RsmB/NOP family class I SAM-dependent RNA methyltransferase [Oceanomicrobium pacificus]|uniref:Methyltransferase domain-containing protein n=1 Tax=Oceanomicrobium pacificus TaxID=2692916 RepID=A0A6B0U6I8_9RHOB|nr:transcription antitermination factor NusB [Oceanomicrobium pacificus]MXU66481.1 methyltransferase domain-containing protein [Oceanomicrobium pacificus]